MGKHAVFFLTLHQNSNEIDSDGKGVAATLRL